MSSDKIVDSVDEELQGTLDNLTTNPGNSDLLESSISGEPIPDKYQGKSVEELVKMHAEAEKLIGRQGTELGTVRKALDDTLRNQALNSNVSTKEVSNEKEEISEFDLLEPEKSVDDRISNHPAIKRMEQIELQNQFNSFTSKHPDWQETVVSDEFRSWVGKSPTRLAMFQKADSHDYLSASDLLDQWAEWQSVIQTAAKEEKKLEEASRDKALNDGMTESGVSTATSKKKFRRHELRRLYTEDREKYDSMSEEIMLAYKEGRVI